MYPRLKTAPAISGLVLLLATPAQLQAQEEPAEVVAAADEGGDFLTLGTGVITVPRYEGSEETIIIPELVVRGRVSGFNFFSRGPAIYADVIRDTEILALGCRHILIAQGTLAVGLALQQPRLHQ